jgi:mRNA-degrading endonuclease RelE of RelBE toxin-antitoxin system
LFKENLRPSQNTKSSHSNKKNGSLQPFTLDTIFNIIDNMQRWVVTLKKEVVEILDQFRNDLETEGPTPKGWVIKHVQGQSGVYAARLKREYRALFEVVTPTIIILSVSHRREAH